MIWGAKIMVFDEPTSSLALHDIENLFKLIRELKAKDAYVRIYGSGDVSVFAIESFDTNLPVEGVVREGNWRYI